MSQAAARARLAGAALARAAMAALCLGAAVLCAVPLLAAGLLALLRYGFGSLFVFGESVAVALLHGTGADIAGTLGRLQAHPWAGAGQAASGLGLSAAAAALAPRRPGVAMLPAAGAAGWALAAGYPVPAALLGAGLACGASALVAGRA